jgi:hypothetical protein
MRRFAPHCLAVITLTAALLSDPRSVVRDARAQVAQPPHAWLFGTWTGGLFPPPTGVNGEACLSQPVVIFTRDIVLRATLTEQTLEQRLISTARAMPGGFEITFQPAAANTTANALFGVTNPPPPPGFGCESRDVLRIQRVGENEILFPGCRDFPNPLVRCPNH